MNTNEKDITDILIIHMFAFFHQVVAIILVAITQVRAMVNHCQSIWRLMAFSIRVYCGLSMLPLPHNVPTITETHSFPNSQDCLRPLAQSVWVVLGSDEPSPRAYRLPNYTTVTLNSYTRPITYLPGVLVLLQVSTHSCHHFLTTRFITPSHL